MMPEFNVSKKLIQRCIDGSNAAWSTLIDRYIGVVYKAVSLALQAHIQYIEKNDINDICQNIFLKLFIDDCSILKSYNFEKSRFSTWITVISRNTTIDFLRKRRERNTSFEDIADDLHIHPGMESGKIDIPTDVVSPRQHLVLRMLYDDDLDVAEAARFLKVKQQTIRSLHHRAMKKLRRHYGLEDAAAKRDTADSI